MSKIRRLQALVQHGLYYLTEHAYDEALADGLDIFDVEYAILTGKIRRSWPREGKYEIVGPPQGLQQQRIGLLSRFVRRQIVGTLEVNRVHLL